MKKLSLLSTALFVAASFAFTVPAMAKITLTDAERARIEERKARKTQLPGERVGRGVTNAFELYNEDKLDDAIKALNEIRGSGDFDNALLARFKGTFYAQKGDSAQAIKYLEQAVKSDLLSFTDHSVSLRLIADLQLGAEKYVDAARTYEALVRFTGEHDPDVYLRIASAYVQSSQHAKALPFVDEAIRMSREPNKNHYILKMGAHYELRQFPKAIETVETMVQLFPEERQYWIYLGQFYTLVEDYQKSLSAYQIAYNNGYLESEGDFRTFGQLFANNNMPYKAATIYEKYLKSGKIKKDRTMLTAIASNFHAAREFAKAAEYYGELAKLTNEAEPYRRQGQALLMVQKYRDALQAFEAALAIDSRNSGRVYLSMVDAHLALGQLREANRAVQRAKEDTATARTARGMESYIRDKARIKNVSL